MKTLVPVIALAVAGCQAEVIDVPYQGLQITLWGPDDAVALKGSADDPFAASKTYEVRLRFYEDAAGTVPYADSLDPLPPEYHSFKPEVTFSGSGSQAVIAPAEDIVLPRLSEDQAEIFVKAEVLGLDADKVVARARCPMLKLGNRDKDASLPATVSCRAFFGLVGKWNPVPRPATPRRQFAAAALPGGLVIIAGGYDVRSPALAPLSTAELFDPAANGGKGGWSALPPLGEARAALTATVTESGNVVFIGGRTSGGFSKKVELFDAATKSMKPLADLFAARGEHAAGLISGERVLAMGGYEATDVPNGAVDVVQPGAQGVQGTIATRVPAGRLTPCVAWVKPNQLLVIGGTTTDRKLWEFNGTEFTELPHELSVARPAPKCASVNEQVFVIGGGTDANANRIEVFKNGTLSPRASFKSLRDHAVAVANGRIVVAGGYMADDASQAPIKGSWYIRPETISIIPDPATEPISMRWARKEHQLVPLPDGTVMAIGGWAPSGAQPGDIPGAEIFVVPDE